MKSTNRIYLDYNSTSPLAPSVSEWLAKGDFYFANPSSIHSSGKKAKRYLTQTTDYLLDFFNLKNSHDVFFHSGATEASNNIVKGFFKQCLIEKTCSSKLSFYYSATDHSCIVNQVEDLDLLGVNSFKIPLDSEGLINWEEFYKILERDPNSKFINITWINNETGVVNDLSYVSELKKKVECCVHVDAVQSVGKIPDFWKLNPDVDLYTYSAHKFGGLKGCGFSFYPSSGFKMKSTIRGGGQQRALRSGTENTYGIHSIKLALDYLKENFDSSHLESTRKLLEEKIEQSLSSNGGYIICKNAPKALSTIYFVVKNAKADQIIMAFDMAQIDISTGSACSSGAVEPSRVLLELGISKEDAKGAIRLSFSPFIKQEETDIVVRKLEQILSRY